MIGCLALPRGAPEGSLAVRIDGLMDICWSDCGASKSRFGHYHITRPALRRTPARKRHPARGKFSFQSSPAPSEAKRRLDIRRPPSGDDRLAAAEIEFLTAKGNHRYVGEDCSASR